jgi:hypothetical protein
MWGAHFVSLEEEKYNLSFTIGVMFRDSNPWEERSLENGNLKRKISI